MPRNSTFPCWPFFRIHFRIVNSHFSSLIYRIFLFHLPSCFTQKPHFIGVPLFTDTLQGALILKAVQKRNCLYVYALSIFKLHFKRFFSGTLPQLLRIVCQFPFTSRHLEENELVFEKSEHFYSFYMIYKRARHSDNLN